MKVHILATCRNPALADATRLIARTWRTGFPSWELILHGNSLPADLGEELRQLCERDDVQYNPLTHQVVHDNWIENLIQQSTEPFWICDTDIIFWKAVEQFPATGPMAGMFMPEFWEEWTQCIHASRLHTCLMRLDPEAIRAGIASYLAQFPKMPFRPTINFFRQQYRPERNGSCQVNHFSDTLSTLYHAIGGRSFTEAELDHFDHVSCATYADLVGPALSSVQDMQGQQARVYKNPELARGLWRMQHNYYNHFRTR